MLYKKLIINNLKTAINYLTGSRIKRTIFKVNKFNLSSIVVEDFETLHLYRINKFNSNLAICYDNY